MTEQEIISKKEVIGLNYNRNMIMLIIGISFILIGVRHFDIKPDWKAFIVTAFGSLMLFIQIDYLVNVGNKFKQLTKK